LVLIKFNSPISNSACIPGAFSDSMAFDVTTAAGKAVLSVLMAAHLSKLTVYAYGTGTCGGYGQASLEYLSFVTLSP
jgi:hypothetical protein